ncbi:MAG: glycosyl transferase, family 9 [Thermoleophilia bacterium]|nr:glycosyl transferase, family 9 [Thermoleophilia bacterium]
MIGAAEFPILLAYRALGVGDLLTGVPALRALAGAFPDHRLVLAAPASLAPLVRLAGVAGTLLDSRAFAPLNVPLIRHGITHVDVAVNLHGRGPQSHRVLRGTNPDRMIGFEDPIRHHGAPAAPIWHEDEHEVHRWCRMLEEHGIPTDADDLEIEAPGPELAAAHGPDVVGSTVLHVGAASGARQWPAARFAEVARSELAAGRSVVFTGSGQERPLAERAAAAAGAPPTSVLAGSTDLEELAAIVAGARAVVCGDTGVAHLATALRTPSVVLFGPTPPRLWGPPPSRPWHVPLWSGSVGDPHADVPDPGLLRITAPDVLTALEQLHALASPIGGTR